MHSTQLFFKLLQATHFQTKFLKPGINKYSE